MWLLTAAYGIVIGACTHCGASGRNCLKVTCRHGRGKAESSPDLMLPTRAKLDGYSLCAAEVRAKEEM